MKAQVKWFSNPIKAYTARVYTKQQDLHVTYNGYTNMIHMDGKEPSGFTESSYNGWRIGGGNSGGDPAEPISISGFVGHMNDQFQATAAMKLEFNGMYYGQAADLLLAGVEHFGMSDYVTTEDINGILVEMDNSPQNDKLFKTEFLLGAKKLAEQING